MSTFQRRQPGVSEGCGARGVRGSPAPGPFGPLDRHRFDMVAPLAIRLSLEQLLDAPRRGAFRGLDGGQGVRNLTLEFGLAQDALGDGGARLLLEALGQFRFEDVAGRKELAIAVLGDLAIEPGGLPAVYFERAFVAAGGLMSYGPNLADQFARAAGYVDRILKGEKPGDLPVQAPTKYDLAINLKTAKVLGITVPPSLLARADEVIEKT